jgi:hemin uptake protein HemP
MSENESEHCETYKQLQKQGISVETPLKIPFEELACGKGSVLITLSGEIYRLQRTRNNKLILTK